MEHTIRSCWSVSDSCIPLSSNLESERVVYESNNLRIENLSFYLGGSDFDAQIHLWGDEQVYIDSSLN